MFYEIVCEKGKDLKGDVTGFLINENKARHLSTFTH